MTYIDEKIDLVAEATAQASAGATTDPDHEQGFDDLVNGVAPDPDLAQGESD
jgi:hypothetical protein